MATKNEKLEFYLQKLESIPSLPNVVIELIKLIDNPMASTSQIEKLLAQDQGLTLRVLKLANSAYYAIPGGAKTLNRAITFLGINAVKQLVLSASVMDAFKKIDGTAFNLVEFWKHSFATAMCSEIISKHIRLSDTDESFICGLIHDVGKLALLMIDKEDFLKTVNIAKEKNISLYQAEVETDSPSHAHWGSVLAKKWKLPQLLQSSIQYHHSSNVKSRVGISAESNMIVDVVFISNQLIHILKFGNSGYDAIPSIHPEVLQRINLKLDPNEEWYQKVVKSLDHADSMVRELTK